MFQSTFWNLTIITGRGEDKEKFEIFHFIAMSPHHITMPEMPLTTKDTKLVCLGWSYVAMVAN